MRDKYPSRVLPFSHYRYRLPMQKLLCDYPELAVVRRCKQTQPFVCSAKEKTKMLSSDAFGDNENLLEMSVNLLGGRFKLKHLPFVPDLELVKKEWDGHSSNQLPLKKNEDYTILSECGSIAFRVAEINTFVFPYSKSIEKKNYDQLIKEAEKIQEKEKLNVEKAIVGAFRQGDNNMTEVYARMHVNHHPNPLNYWHMQMDVYAVGQETYVKYDDSSKEARRIRHQLRVFLTRKAICKLGKRYHIGKRYYMHDASSFSYIFDGCLNWFMKTCCKFQYVSVYSD